MRKKTFLNIIVLLTFLIAVVLNSYGRKGQGPLAINEADLRSIMPEGDSFRKNEAPPFRYYEVYRENGLIGYCLNTADAAPDERGYNGPIEMLVALDKDCGIKDLKILRHSETPEYVAGMLEPKFLNQFKQKGPEDRFIVGEDVDNITRATISVKAVAGSLKTSVDKMQSVIYGESGTIRPKARAIDLKPDFYITVSIITFLLIAFYLKIYWLRFAGFIISIVYFGFMKASFISMANVGSLFLWRVPDFKSNITWYAFIFSGLILTFLLGGFYCSSICPFGRLQVLLNRLFKFKVEITPAIAGNLRKIRYILLWVLSVLLISLNNPGIANYEPFSTVFLGRGTVTAWSILVIILSLSIFHYRPFCNYFCAAGAFLDILADAGKKILRKK